MKKIFGGTETKLINYIDSVFQPEDSLLRNTREQAEKSGLPMIQMAKMDCLHLEILTRMIGAKKAVEIGTLGGYSGMSILRGMGPSGKLYTFEIEKHHADIARIAFLQGKFSNQVEIIVGPALETLPTIDKYGPFDLVFIDADKVNYPAYLRWTTQNLRVGGVVIGDNTFAWGTIANDTFETSEDEAAAQSLRQFNLELAQGGRFRATILPTGEGLTVGVKVQ